MKISSIQQQTKRADRYSIFVDGKYSFSLSEGQLLDFGLSSGLELTDQELEEFKQKSTEGKIFDKTLNLLSYRPRSEWELRDYLKRNKQSPALIDNILNKLSKSGYINDELFARRWVESRRLLKPTSSRKLYAELKQKRIASEIIDKILGEEVTDEREVLRQVVHRKRARYPDQTKFMRYLAGQGFRYDDIKAVLNEEDN